MRFCVLGSGSKGNCTYVEAAGTAILIDAGLSGLEVQRRLETVGVDFSRLSAIIVTHEHTDHIRGVAVLSRRAKLPVYANPATFAAAGPTLQKLHASREFEAGATFQCRDLHIHPFAVSHDTADPVGFVITDGRFSLGYCTDTGMISRLMRYRLAPCHGLILECNHDPEILDNGPYPPFLKQRVRGNQGHLANGDAADLLREISHDRLEHVVLAHLSEINNRPEIAHNTVREVWSAGQPRPVLSVACQDRPDQMVELGKF